MKTLKRRPLATAILLTATLILTPSAGVLSSTTANAIPPRCHELPPGDDPVPMGLPVSAEGLGRASDFAYEPDEIEISFSTAGDSDLVAELAVGNDVDVASDNEIQCGGRIPARLLLSSTRVNMNAFVVKKGPSTFEQRGQVWYVQRDHSGHGGTFWKLFSSTGQRIASLLQDGTIKRG